MGNFEFNKSKSTIATKAAAERLGVVAQFSFR
jgi:hypothetical protein